MNIDLTPEEEERVRRRIRERGLTFEVFLPEGIADWVRARVAEGSFTDPSEAAFVAFQRFIELWDHPEVEKQLLLAVLNERMNDSRPGIPSEQVFADMEANIRKLAEPDDASE
jgi:Arc/MetJ-type ribon-helix-helix transcriptional regulator